MKLINSTTSYFELFFLKCALNIYVFWIILLLEFFYIITFMKSSFQTSSSTLKGLSKFHLNVLRKTFHLLIFLIILVPIKYYNDLLVFSLVKSCCFLILCLFIGIEYIRFYYPNSFLSLLVSKYLLEFLPVNQYASRHLILDHITLMAGVTFPLFMYVTFTYF